MVARLMTMIAKVKVGDTFVTPSGIRGIIIEVTKSGNARIKWDGIKEAKELSKTDVHKALKKGWIEFIGCAHHVML